MKTGNGEASTCNSITLTECISNACRIPDNFANATVGTISCENTDTVLDPVKIEARSEMSVQANDYEIERATGFLPARRRYIPFKYRDYQSLVKIDDADEADYDPDIQSNIKKHRVKRGRGRPRKHPEHQNEADLPVAISDSEKPSAVTTTYNEETKIGMQRVAKGFKCLACNKVFSQKGNLRAHFLTHTGERPWWCDIENCGKTFRTKESLRRHKMSHLGIKPFECDECKKKFCSTLSLQEHMSLHNNSKPYSCSDCQRTFRQVSCLRRHMLTHTSDMPHSCQICGRRFSQAIYLRSHMKTHTGEKPFACQQCGKNFAHASDLSRHRVIHTGAKPYACGVCNAVFNDPSSRRRHEREHVGEKSYFCQLCSDSFKRASQLRAHLFRHHGSQKKDAADGVKVEEMCYTIEVHGDCEPGTSARNVSLDDLSGLDLSESDQKKIMELLANVQGSVVVRLVRREGQPIVTEAALDGQEIATVTDLDLASTCDLQQLTVPMEMAAVMEGELRVVEAMGEQELEHTYAIVQSESVELMEVAGQSYAIFPQGGQTGLEGEQQVFEVRYHQASVFASGPSTVSLASMPSAVTNTPAMDNATLLVPPLSAVAQTTSSAQSVMSDTHLTPVATPSEVAITGTPSMQASSAADTDSSLGMFELPAKFKADFVSKPDFSSQEYYDWLSSFIAVCKLMSIPLEVEVFRTISLVHKTLSDFMASPSGVIAEKDNFAILMNISKELNIILNDHLTCMLNKLT